MKKLNKNSALKDFADSIKRNENPEVIEKNGELFLSTTKDWFNKNKSENSSDNNGTVVFFDFNQKKRIEK